MRNNELPPPSRVPPNSPNTDWAFIIGRRVRLKQRLSPSSITNHSESLDRLTTSGTAEVLSVNTYDDTVTLYFGETGRTITFTSDFFYAVK